MADRRILFVHAHPDDESIASGATMAKYAAEGAHVTLVTCTLGEEGEILLPDIEHFAADREDRLGHHRIDELAAAMKVLGVDDHRFLGGAGRYRDSGMVWGEDGHAYAGEDIHPAAFWSADLTAAANDMVEIVREVRPQVVVTYDEFGGYGHPDHIQAHRVTMYATQLAGIRSYRSDLGEAWNVDKIYWVAMSAAMWREGMAQAEAAGTATEFDFMGFDSVPPFALEDDDLDARIEANAWVGAKMDAMRAHASQIAVDGPFFALSNNIGQLVWGQEFYRLAVGTRGPVGARGLEEDLFSGL